MKRRISVLTLLCATLLASCQLDDEMYSIYDVYYELAFVTDSSNSVLRSAAFLDSLAGRTDVELNVKGGFEYAASDIVRYGHCWGKGEVVPTINADETNCKYYNGTPSTGETFTSLITGLECETEYSVRSFVMTSDGKIGYNPKTLIVRTDTPHDKWFEAKDKEKIPFPFGRADGVHIETVVKNDTLTFFGMGRTGDNCFSDIWCYSSHQKTYEQVASVTTNTNETMKLWGAVGFGINYAEGTGERNLIYLGCGCTRATDFKLEDYNKKFFVYDIGTRKWDEVMYYGTDGMPAIMTPFQGQPRTGGIGFSIREWGFVGLGEVKYGSMTTALSDIYLFVMQKDNNGNYEPKRGYFNQMTEDFGFGARSGASVVVVDDMAYIIGGKGNASGGEFIYYDDFISCKFTMPINSRPDSYTFTWPKSDKLKRLGEQFEGRFQGRAYASAFNVGGVVFYGMGEGYDRDGNFVYFSDMIKYDNGKFLYCAPYMNEDMEASRVSRSFVVNGGDRAFVGGGAMPSADKDYTEYSYSQWVYRP